MSLLNAIKVKLGISNTQSNNFELDASAANGSMKIARSSGQDVMTVDASGKVNFPVSKSIETPVKDALNASGSAPIFGCRAWVNFDGTRDSTGAFSTANTARLIRASGNVSSVVRNGTGEYTIDFTTAMPDANYAISVSSWNNANGQGVSSEYGGANGGLPQSRNVSSVRVMSCSTAGTFIDVLSYNVAIFR